MSDMELMSAKIDDLDKWRIIADFRLSSHDEDHRAHVKEYSQLKGELSAVDRKVSRIEGGIDFLKWSIPVSISAATAIGAVIVWVMTRGA